MTPLIAIFVVLFGLAFGSFLNVCIFRLPRHASLMHPPSHCPHCDASICAYDNIPLLSWIVLRARCRACSSPISARYPLVEAATAGLFVACWLRFGLNVHGLGRVIFCFLAFGLAMMDWETMLLPDAFTLPGTFLGLLYAGLEFRVGLGRGFWAGMLLALACGAAAFALILMIRGVYWLVRRREGMGLGDAKLLAMIAVWLGLGPTLVTLFLGVIAAALYGVGLLLIHRNSQTGEPDPLRLPFGSFLCAGALYAVFWGEITFNWYLRFFR